MVLEKFGSALKNVMNKIARSIFLDRKTVDEILSELRRVLIGADVDLKIVNEMLEKLKDTALSEKIKGIEKREQLIKLLHDELVGILGKKKYELQIEKKNSLRMMLVGLYGCGKTTTMAKLALYYSKRGLKVCMLGLDVHRPAASEQLEQLGKQIKIDTFVSKSEKNPEKILKEFESKLKGYDLTLVDTAGRNALDKELTEEIKNIDKLVKPHYTILVMPADIGQGARKQALEFQNACDISGVILTRMDGTAKAGGALAACYETKAPVLFIGTGEHVHDIEAFSPTAFVSRMLGLGDIETLLEKIKSVDEGKEKKPEKEEFTLINFYEQIKSMQKLGPLGKIADLIPGLGNVKLPSDLLEVQQEKLKRWKYAIDSMTLQEIENPDMLEKQTTRVARIAKGSGVAAGEIREMIQQYKLLKGFASKGQSLDLEKIQRSKDLSSLGISQKQLKKLAKKFKF